MSNLVLMNGKKRIPVSIGPARADASPSGASVRVA